MVLGANHTHDIAVFIYMHVHIRDVRYEEFSVSVYGKNYTGIIGIPAFREENSLPLQFEENMILKSGNTL